MQYNAAYDTGTGVLPNQLNEPKILNEPKTLDKLPSDIKDNIFTILADSETERDIPVITDLKNEYEYFEDRLYSREYPITASGQAMFNENTQRIQRKMANLQALLGPRRQNFYFYEMNLNRLRAGLNIYN